MPNFRLAGSGRGRTEEMATARVWHTLSFTMAHKKPVGGVTDTTSVLCTVYRLYTAFKYSRCMQGKFKLPPTGCHQSFLVGLKTFLILIGVLLKIDTDSRKHRMRC